MADCYLTNQSQKLTYVIESSIFSGGSLGGDYVDTLNFITSTGCIVILSTNDGYFYYSSHSAADAQGIQRWYFTGTNNSNIGYVIEFNEFAESWNLNNIAIPDVSKYLPLTGGTLTGNLTGKYLTGTWLQGTASNHSTTAATKIAIQDSQGWIYHRTAAEIKSDIGVPTKVSELTNDSGYITKDSLPTVDTAISSTSTNAVTNKAIAAKFMEYDPLIDDADILTYDQIKEQVIAGKPLAVTVNDNSLGNITFTNFTLNSDLSTVSSNLIQYYKDPSPDIPATYVLRELVFNSSGYSLWKANLATSSDIPTKVSQLTNDSGFLTQHQSLDNYALKSAIPTKTSQLTNDSGFLTQHQSLDNYALKSYIPTKTSQLTNDSGFLTSHQSLSGYAKETWVTQQIQSAIDATWEASY